MNINVKVEGEDEQPVHFPNRTTIALQSGAAAYINLNIVNPNLSNQGYILNPMSPVPQNLVAYQTPVTLQSYIALQEPDGNIMNNLQVGVPVPIGLPVPAELLQNPNLVNTSIIIGNEECNQPMIFKPAPNSGMESNDIKFGYQALAKPVVQNVKSAMSAEDPNMRMDMSGISMENLMKKPCPLEMSIKAANIDLEFEKCEPEELVPETNGLMSGSGFPIIQKMPMQEVIHRPVPEKIALNVPVKLEEAVLNMKKPKTEITWEDNGLQDQATSNEFRESLICEVEEANEDEDEESYDTNGTSSSEDIEEVPLSVVLKLRRVQDEDEKDAIIEKKGKDSKFVGKEWNKNTTKNYGQKSLESEVESNKFMKVRHCCSKKECFKKITVKDQKIAHKSFYELESELKQDAYLINCIEHIQTNKSLNSENAKESNWGGYKGTEAEHKTLLDVANMQMEIENESNGNQMLSDEIQKAINESLKDCMESQIKKEQEEEDDVALTGNIAEQEEAKDSSDDDEEVKSPKWNYYIVIDRCRKRVCLQFLLKLFRIPKSRMKMLREKILSGQPLLDDVSSTKTSEKSSDMWELARTHLITLAGHVHPLCSANPRHRYLNEEISAENLFDKFKDFYMEKTGREVKVKIRAYKRFLRRNGNVFLSQNKSETCSECDLLEQEKKRKRGQEGTTKSNRSFQTRKKGRKKCGNSTDSDSTSDDEPLVKRKKLKLTISLKGNKVQNPDKEESLENEKKKKKKSGKDGKGKGNGVKGRDVWSLMLLHLETMPYKVCKSCVNRKRHRFFDASMTTQTLYEDYRRYFLKETNSELGLGFSMYEKYFDRNCGYTIGNIDVDSPVCPRCALEQPKHEGNKPNRKNTKSCNNNVRSTRVAEITL